MIEPLNLPDTELLSTSRAERMHARFQRLRAGEAVMSVITYGELLCGIAKEEVGPEPLQRLQEPTQIVPVIGLLPETAIAYGRIRPALHVRGDLIGANDLWIATHAITVRLILVTNNEREFRRIPDLKIENWTE